MSNLKQFAAILIGLGLCIYGGLKLADGYKHWKDAQAAEAQAQGRLAAAQRSVADLKARLARARKARLDKDIVNAALDFVFNVGKEAAKWGVQARVMIGGGGNMQTVDFARISEPVPNAKGIVRIPVSIQITDWDSSDRLLSWMDNSLLARQFMPDTLAFVRGAMTIKGHVYGRRKDGGA